MGGGADHPGAAGDLAGQHPRPGLVPGVAGQHGEQQLLGDQARDQAGAAAQLGRAGPPGVRRVPVPVVPVVIAEVPQRLPLQPRIGALIGPQRRLVAGRGEVPPAGQVVRDQPLMHRRPPAAHRVGRPRVQLRGPVPQPRAVRCTHIGK